MLFFIYGEKMKRKSLMILMFICLTAVKMFAENVMTVKCDNYEISVPTGWMAQRTNGDTVFILYSPIEENDTIQENCVLTFTSDPANFNRYLNTFKSIYKTFKF